jgi:hypothetical protein
MRAGLEANNMAGCLGPEVVFNEDCAAGKEHGCRSRSRPMPPADRILCTRRTVPTVAMLRDAKAGMGAIAARRPGGGLEATRLLQCWVACGLHGQWGAGVAQITRQSYVWSGTVVSTTINTRLEASAN